MRSYLLIALLAVVLTQGCGLKKPLRYPPDKSNPAPAPPVPPATPSDRQ